MDKHVPFFRWRFRHVLFVVIACLALPTGVDAFEEPAQVTASEMRAADTSSPRSTLRSFIDACNKLYRLIEENQYVDADDEKTQALAAQVLDCVDATELPEFARVQRAGEVAVCLKEILDRHQLPRWEDIPDVAAIEAAGGFEKFSRWRVPGTRITIARVEEGAQKHEYLFSTGTVDRAVAYYESVAGRPYRTGGPDTSPGFHTWYLSSPRHEMLGRVVRYLPEGIRHGRTFGMANWKWPGLFGAVIVAVLLMAALYRLHSVFGGRFRGQHVFMYCATIVFPVAAMVVPLVFERFVLDYIAIRGTALYVVSFCAISATILAAVVVVFAACHRVADLIIASPRINPQGLNAQLIRIASQLMSVSLSVIVFLVGGQYLGIPVATLLTSAGIGGVALALGAQDTLKTLFGTLMLMADKPFRVGERIVFKGYEGVVEDIGIRSTRVRLLTNHQVTIPNDQLAGSDIENVGRRQSIRRVTDIHLPLDTPYEKLETALAVIRAELEDHEGMSPDYPPRVYFFDFLPAAFTIRVIYWYHPPKYWDYLAFGEKFNLGVFRGFDQHGIQFSVPHRITHTSLESEQAPLEVSLSDLGRREAADRFGPARGASGSESDRTTIP